MFLGYQLRPPPCPPARGGSPGAAGETTGLASGTLYPLLGRLQEQGLVTSEWEPRSASAGGRPPRRYYQLTGEGARVARLELARAGATGPALPRGERPAARPGSGTAR